MAAGHWLTATERGKLVDMIENALEPVGAAG
jgi:hypothetical protein